MIDMVAMRLITDVKYEFAFYAGSVFNGWIPKEHRPNE